MFYKLNKLENFMIWVWPIKSFELPKFLSMVLLMFIILLNQNIVRTIKDSLVATLIAPEAITFIKLWCEMPLGFLFVLLYSKLCNIMTTEQVFRIVVSAFIIFFIIFAFVLFPNQEYLHPNPMVVEYSIEKFPFLKWFFILWGKWTFVLFYSLGELWPVIIFSLLFWQLANKINTVEEAKRYYSFFNLFGQTNLLISGILIAYIIRNHNIFSFLYNNEMENSELTIKNLIIFIAFLGLGILFLQYIIEKQILKKNVATTKETKNDFSKEFKLNLRDSIKFIIKSKYLGLICILVTCYNMAVTLIEGLWMAKVREVFPKLEDFIDYRGKVLFWIGVFTLLCSLLTSIFIRKFQWLTVAIITPIIFTVVGLIFFTFSIFEESLEFIFLSLSYSIPMLIVFIGGMQDVLVKSAKYTLFDTTKEISYIPLDMESKTKGKAAVDILGAKIGKSFASALQFMLFTFLPLATYNDITVFLMIIFLIVCIIWMVGVKGLSEEIKLV